PARVQRSKPGREVVAGADAITDYAALEPVDAGHGVVAQAGDVDHAVVHTAALDIDVVEHAIARIRCQFVQARIEVALRATRRLVEQRGDAGHLRCGRGRAAADNETEQALCVRLATAS